MTDDGDKLTRSLRRELDQLTYGELYSRLGPPKVLTTFAAGQGYWRQGDGPPAIRPENPADAQVIGRCLASRTRYGRIGAFDGLHPGPCGWCDYPTDELLRACDWATWHSRYVADEVALWEFLNAVYVRSTGRAGEYDNPEWAGWFEGATPSTEDRPPSERAHLRSRRRDAIEGARALDRQA